MNANELAKKIENYCYWSIIDFHYIKEAADMLRTIPALEAEIDKVNTEWVRAAMALGKCVQENHDLKAEIAILKNAQEN